MSVTTVEIAIHSLFNGCYDDATVVLYYRWCWFDNFCNALYLYRAVRGYIKVIWHQMIGVAPFVVGVVNGVVIHEGGVAAAVGDVASIDAFLKGNIRAAVGDVGQGGGEDLRETVNRSGIVGCRREAFRIQGVSESPDGVVSGAVGITVTEDHSSCAIAVEGCGAVHKDRCDAVATDILNDLC